MQRMLAGIAFWRSVQGWIPCSQSATAMWALFLHASTKMEHLWWVFDVYWRAVPRKSVPSMDCHHVLKFDLASMGPLQLWSFMVQNFIKRLEYILCLKVRGGGVVLTRKSLSATLMPSKNSHNTSAQLLYSRRQTADNTSNCTKLVDHGYLQ